MFDEKRWFTCLLKTQCYLLHWFSARIIPMIPLSYREHFEIAERQRCHPVVWRWVSLEYTPTHVTRCSVSPLECWQGRCRVIKCLGWCLRTCLEQKALRASDQLGVTTLVLAWRRCFHVVTKAWWDFFISVRRQYSPPLLPSKNRDESTGGLDNSSVFSLKEVNLLVQSNSSLKNQSRLKKYGIQTEVYSN